MIIWGSGGKSIELGQSEVRRCSTCEKDRPFKVFLNYRYSHLYYIFGWITQKKYLLVCDVCHRGWELDAKKFEAERPKPPIPFTHRYGWTIPVGIAAVGILLAVFGS
jgi:hypothetical protein